NHSQHRCAVKVKCTNNQLFLIRPPLGILNPGQSASVNVKSWFRFSPSTVTFRPLLVRLRKFQNPENIMWLCTISRSTKTRKRLGSSGKSIKEILTGSNESTFTSRREIKNKILKRAMTMIKIMERKRITNFKNNLL